MITPVTAFPLSLKAGQKGTINLKLTSGASYSSVLAAIFVNGTSQKLTCSSSGVITLPAMPVGLHLLEVRVGSVSAIYQHVEVLPTPISQSDPSSATFDIAQDPVNFGSWTIEGGRQGPAGAAGPAGKDGAPGADGKDGVTFTPHLDGSVLSWTNDGNRPNPESLDLGVTGGGGSSNGDFLALLDVLFSPSRVTTEQSGNTASQSLLFSELRTEGKFFTPPMLLHSVTLWAQSAPAKNPLYLTLWEESPDGSSEWRFRACSKPATVQGGHGTTFAFEPSLIITGKGIRFGCVAPPTSQWPDDNSIFVPVLMGIRDTDLDDESWSQGEDGSQYYYVPTHQLTYTPLPIAVSGKDGQDGQDGKDGKNGVTFTPHMSSDGTLTWTNDGNLPNPDPVSLVGPQGPPGKDGTSSSGSGSGSGTTDYNSLSYDKEYRLYGGDFGGTRPMSLLYLELRARDFWDFSTDLVTSKWWHYPRPLLLTGLSFTLESLPSSTSLYLTLWEDKQGNGQWQYRACSKVAKILNETGVKGMTFDFDPPILLTGAAIRVGCIASPTSLWPSDNSIFKAVYFITLDTPVGDEDWGQGADGTQYYVYPLVTYHGYIPSSTP